VKAHDLLLPRGTKIDASFGTAVHADVPLPPEEVSNFIRAQSEDAVAVYGPNGTVFPNFHVKGADPGHHLRVELSVIGVAVGTHVLVDRIDERPEPPKMPNDQAMEKAGLNPDGTLKNKDKIE
jgi:hypothetical protein